MLLTRAKYFGDFCKPPSCSFEKAGGQLRLEIAFGNSAKRFPRWERRLANASFPLDLMFARQIAFESEM
jgi:hypothetical protein